MQPGDTIRHYMYPQVDAQYRVLGYINTCLIVMADTDGMPKPRIRVVLPWAYRLLREGGEGDRSLARMILSSDATKEALLKWLLGSQID